MDPVFPDLWPDLEAVKIKIQFIALLQTEFDLSSLLSGNLSIWKISQLGEEMLRMKCFSSVKLK